MQTWWLNSRKCSIAKLALALSALLASSSLFASPAPTVITDSLLKDIHDLRTNSFQELLTRWEVRYGTDAYAALSKIADNRTLSDKERYIGIMGMAKIGGSPSAPQLTHLLKDPSWMVRNASLQAISALNNPQTSNAVLPMMKDPALVIRAQAVEVVEKLKPEGYQDACVEALKDPANYYRGKAQWVPQKALAVLKRNAPTDDAADRKKLSLQLISIAKSPRDTAIEPILLLTLEKVSGKSLDTRKTLPQALAQLEAEVRK